MDFALAPAMQQFLWVCRELGGSWVVISGVMSRVAILITHIRVFITLLITTHGTSKTVLMGILVDVFRRGCSVLQGFYTGLWRFSVLGWGFPEFRVSFRVLGSAKKSYH